MTPPVTLWRGSTAPGATEAPAVGALCAAPTGPGGWTLGGSAGTTSFAASAGCVIKTSGAVASGCVAASCNTACRTTDPQPVGELGRIKNCIPKASNTAWNSSDMAIATERRRSASAWLRRRKLSTLKIFLRGRFTGCSKATAAPRVRSGRLLELGR